MGHSTPTRQPGAARITQGRYPHALLGELIDAKSVFERWLAEVGTVSTAVLAQRS